MVLTVRFSTAEDNHDFGCFGANLAKHGLMQAKNRTSVTGCYAQANFNQKKQSKWGWLLRLFWLIENSQVICRTNLGNWPMVEKTWKSTAWREANLCWQWQKIFEPNRAGYDGFAGTGNLEIEKKAMHPFDDSLFILIAVIEVKSSLKRMILSLWENNVVVRRNPRSCQ